MKKVLLAVLTSVLVISFMTMDLARFIFKGGLMKKILLAVLLMVSAPVFAQDAQNAELKGISVGMQISDVQKLFPDLVVGAKPDTYKGKTTIMNQEAEMTINVSDSKVERLGFTVSSNSNLAPGILQGLMVKFPGFVCDGEQHSCEVLVGKSTISYINYTFAGGGSVLIFVNPVKTTDL